LIKRHPPWRSVGEVEYATSKWEGAFNHRRLYSYRAPYQNEFFQ
jgi:hypothetical protein